MNATPTNDADVRVLQADELDTVAGGRNTVYVKLDDAKIPGKGTLVFGSIEVNGYALPFAQWHPGK